LLHHAVVVQIEGSIIGCASTPTLFLFLQAKVIALLVKPHSPSTELIMQEVPEATGTVRILLAQSVLALLVI
jgi:hypothetical protein